ncbi:hypothetical protein BKA63DRAFT_82697 [Paraphoma chrysanthemicola]|nr:hypothetical protein BKA63DRAFT_82697 [Paraphoma chrysanthemicola]
MHLTTILVALLPLFLTTLASPPKFGKAAQFDIVVRPVNGRCVGLRHRYTPQDRACEQIYGRGIVLGELQKGCELVLFQDESCGGKAGYEKWGAEKIGDCRDLNGAKSFAVNCF